MMKMKHRWAIVDLDGSISDCSARSHLARAARRETDPTRKAELWAEFHAGCVFDPPHEAELALVQAWLQCGGRVAFLTGRTDTHRDVTQRWLTSNGLPQTPLLMRPAGYTGLSTDYKRDRLDVIRTNFMKPGDVIAFILEDHDRLVAMWRELGYTCLQPRLGVS